MRRPAAAAIVGCRAAGAQALRLSGCMVRSSRAAGTLAIGERIVRGRKGFLVDVEPDPGGQEAPSGRPCRATLVVAGTDSLGRTATARRKVSVRG